MRFTTLFASYCLIRSFAAGWAQQIYAKDPTLLMAYPMLPDTEWKCGKPDPELRSAYMAELMKAVNALNKVGAFLGVCLVHLGHVCALLFSYSPPML